MEDKVIFSTKTFRYEVRITSFLRGNGGAHLKMKSTAKTRKTRKLMMSVEGMHLLKKDFKFFI